jgi:SRSO17 transposase
VLVVDDTDDRKDGSATAHVARQYLGSVGKTDNGIVAVTSLWADPRGSWPLHAVAYTPASRLAKGTSAPEFRTKPQPAAELVSAAQQAKIPFRAVVADCLYGDNPGFVEAPGRAGVAFVLALRRRYHHPCRLAQRSRTAEIISIAANTTARWGKSVRSFTMMFIPYTDDSAVIGKVRTAIRVSRSAAIVILVSVRALRNSITPSR